jgi:DNA-binding Xre family transcriptional regulator
MTYPSKEEILEMLADIEKKNKNKKRIPLKPLSRDASFSETWKFRISQKISEFKVTKGLSLEDMSQILQTDKANLSRIMNGHLDKITLDKLLSYLEILLVASKNKKIADKFHNEAEKFFKMEDIKFG